MAALIDTSARLRADLDRLASAAASVDLEAGRESTKQRHREGVVTSVRGYLLPRLVSPRSPLLLAVIGPTGSGKSTIVNSLAGETVFPTGPLRPTTSAPLVWSRDPGPHTQLEGIRSDTVTGDHPLLDHYLIVDTPDLDSTARDHREQALAVAERADVIVLVTSAIRYADAVPWRVLGRIADRTALVIPILNRLGRRTSGALIDYQRMLREAGIAEEAIIAVQEHRLHGTRSVLPPPAIEGLRQRLQELASKADDIVDRVVRGTVADVLRRARLVSGELSEIVAAVEKALAERGA